MHRPCKQIVALAAAAAWMFQAWLGVAHVHPHSHESSPGVSAGAACHAHSHEHAADHNHASQAPAQPPGDEHDSSDCQICRMLAQQPLPFVASVELTDAASLPDVVTFSIDVPTMPPLRLFQSRAPPQPTV